MTAAIAAPMTLSDMIATGERVDLLFTAPGRAQIAMLDEFYVDGPGTLDRSLPVHRLIADAAAAAILTTARHQAVVERELLPRCGFSRPFKIPVLGPFDVRNFNGATILIIARRGAPDLILPQREDLIRRPTVPEAMRMAERLLPFARRKLHLFAEYESDGWTSLVGDNSWIEVPTFR